MSTFLISKNNLADLTDVEKARNHLGIGTLAIQNSNDVYITGGSISVSNLVLLHEDVQTHSFVVSTDDKGTLGFYKPDIKEWINSNQEDIDIGLFSNDMGYVREKDLAHVVFTGDYNDLLNTPCNIQDLFMDSAFLLTSNNLSDIEDIDIAKSNLGLGPFASFSTSDTITISNLYVMNNFHFMPSRNTEDVDKYLNKYLRLNSTVEEDGSIQTEWVDLPVAGLNGNTYGLLQITNDYTLSNEYTAPSSYALRLAYNELNGKIVNTTDQQFMIDLINNYGLLIKYNNLSEFADHLDEVKSNLNLGTLSEQHSNTVNVHDLTISGDLFFRDIPIEGFFLQCAGPSGKAQWSRLPEANMQNKGIVYATDDINTTNNLESTVLNMQGFSNVHNTLSNMITEVELKIPTKVRDLEDWRDFCLISDAFENINADKAKENLSLHQIAWTGDYKTLSNLPVNLSYFNNDTFLTKNSNLGDLVDISEARANLGMGTMCTQNADNVSIENGVAAFNNLTVTDSFIFNKVPNEVDLENQVYYLTAADPSGKVAWNKIVEATEELYGVVQLTHDISKKNSLHKVASATAVSKVYTILTDRIERINERINRLR